MSRALLNGPGPVWPGCTAHEQAQFNPERLVHLGIPKQGPALLRQGLYRKERRCRKPAIGIDERDPQTAAQGTAVSNSPSPLSSSGDRFPRYWEAAANPSTQANLPCIISYLGVNAPRPPVCRQSSSNHRREV